MKATASVTHLQADGPGGGCMIARYHLCIERPRQGILKTNFELAVLMKDEIKTNFLVQTLIPRAPPPPRKWLSPVLSNYSSKAVKLVGTSKFGASTGLDWGVGTQRLRL